MSRTLKPPSFFPGTLRMAAATACALCLTGQGLALPITAVPVHADGIYKTGEKVAWTITSTNAATLHATVKKNDAEILWEGEIRLTDGQCTLETSLSEPGMILASISINPKDKKTTILLGAAVNPYEIQSSAPRPADFDQFWQSQIKALSIIPPNPRVTAAESVDPAIEYSLLTLANINGSHVYGQLAKPAGAGKWPAMLIVQWAGVYGLPKSNVISPAQQGWLALNIMAHDLPLDQPEAFYKEVADTTLKNYTAIGNESRTTSYFLRMILGCYRAADYLTEHPDWNGRTLVVTGTSQGGLQGLATAGLHSAITAVMVNVPAGCDTTAPWVNRSVAWPYWHRSTQGKDEKNVMETSRYFDAVNFAAGIRCPALLAIGMIDQTSTPAGVLAAFNQIQGPKEAVLMLNSPHQNQNNSQAPWQLRSRAWFEALRRGDPAPLPK